MLEKLSKIPNILYHGTSNISYQNIKKSGKIKSKYAGMKQDVHLTNDIDIAKEFAKRSKFMGYQPIVLLIDAKQMEEDGYTFYKGFNDTHIVTDIVPIKYIRTV